MPVRPIGQGDCVCRLHCRPSGSGSTCRHRRADRRVVVPLLAAVIDRRRFLSALGPAGALLATTSWLEAIGYAQAADRPARVLQPVPARGDFDRRVLGVLSRASRARRLQRGVRTGLAVGGRERLPHRRRARGEGAGRADRPLPGRQLRLRLQLARRRRSQGAAADGAGAGVELARDESVRHQRLHRLVPRRRHRAAARHELRHRHRGDGGGLRRVLQRRSRHEVERPSPGARLRAAAQRALLVPGQRDGRPVADRPAAGARVRTEGARRREADAGHRPRRAAHRLRVERHQHAAVPGRGIARYWRSATTRWTASRCTPTTAIPGR